MTCHAKISSMSSQVQSLGSEVAQSVQQLQELVIGGIASNVIVRGSERIMPATATQSSVPPVNDWKATGNPNLETKTEVKSEPNPDTDFAPKQG